MVKVRCIMVDRWGKVCDELLVDPPVKPFIDGTNPVLGDVRFQLWGRYLWCTPHEVAVRYVDQKATFLVEIDETKRN